MSEDGVVGGAGEGAGESESASTSPVLEGTVVDLKIESELRDSYLTYAMSTIMDRALPDVRDGLKPSQRRILVAMHDLKLRPGRKHLKCAKICGNTSGDYHPHGESVIYPTLVGLAQSWKTRVPLVDPQGNFGSIEGDPPAAMRYTEARMTQASVDMLADLELGTVDFQPNYDDRLEEPTVLPGKFPNLLVNGGMGIAVGMATSLPPHNPVEVLDSITRVLDNPEITLAELTADELDEDGNVLRRGLKGPDFPTGGVIQGRRGIVQAYSEGRGRVVVRGVCHVETSKTGRESLVIDQIPYALMQNTLVEKIVEAVRDERIKDISDVRNESGRQAQTRIVVELKKGADARVVENQLYSHTPLQQTFSIINIALVKRQPRTLGLRELIDLYVEHRVEVIRRRTEHLLREAKKRAHVLEGMIFAVCDIDEVVALIRSSRTRDEAISKLMERKFQIPADHPFAPRIPERLMRMVRDADGAGGVELTRVQAETIGNMRLIQLVGLEIERLVGEYAELAAQIEDYEAILADRGRVVAIIKDDCAEMRERYARPRLTSIEDAAGDISIEELIQEHDVAVTISHQGYVKRVPAETYRAQGRGGKGIRAGDSKDGDFIERVFVASTHDNLLCFTDTGRVFKMKVYEVPELGRTSRGRAIVNLLELQPGETTRTFTTVDDFKAGDRSLITVSSFGLVKRTELSEYERVNRGGKKAVKLRDDDSLVDAIIAEPEDHLLLVTAFGSAIRFKVAELEPRGRDTQGVKGIDLREGDRVVGVVRVPMLDDERGALPGLGLLTVTENGYGKRTAVDEYLVQPAEGPARPQSRGGKGRADIKTTARNGKSVAAIGVLDGDDVMVMTRSGLLVRFKGGSVSMIGRGTQGVRVVKLNAGDGVVAVTRVQEGDEEEGGTSENGVVSGGGSESDGTGPGDGVGGGDAGGS